MIKPKLVKDWKTSWKKFSMQALLLSSTLSGAYLSIPDPLRVLIPPQIALGITGTIAVLGVVGSLIDQGLKND
jgi:hypothetical protein